MSAPEFIRLPSPGKSCPHTSMKRGALYILTVPCEANGFTPAVPAKCLRQPGNVRGLWLIPLAPLVAHLRALPTPGLKQPAKAPGARWSLKTPAPAGGFPGAKS